MTILDPRTGNQCDENGNTIVSYDAFRQRLTNREALKNRVPKPVPLLTKEFDRDAGRFVETIHVDRGPGDER